MCQTHSTDAQWQALLWENFHPRLLDICVVLAPIRLPPYVLLEIVDWLPVVHIDDENESLAHRVSHVKKIRLIEGVQRSQRTIDRQREQQQQDTGKMACVSSE